MGLNGDALGWASWTTGNDEIMLVRSEGYAIRFKEEEVRPMGLAAAGVKGVKLGGRNDRVVGMMVVRPGADVWVITQDGSAKRTKVEEYPTQGRYGQGVIAMKFKSKQKWLAAAALGTANENLVVVTSKGKPKYMRFSLAPTADRYDQGQAVIALGSNETVEYVLQPRSFSFESVPGG